MTLYHTILDEIRSHSASTDLEKIDLTAFTHQLSQLIESDPNIVRLPQEVLKQSIPPVIQLMLAQDHSSIETAAQYAYQIYVTQVSEDPHATIPQAYRKADLCPYPGLAAFTQENAGYFYGREQLIDEILDQINRTIIVITGPSGIGKSSFVQAGLVQRLSSSSTDLGENNLILINNSTDFIQNIYKKLEVESNEEDYQKWYERFIQSDDSLFLAFQKAHQTNTQAIYCVLDQFEELFVSDDQQLSQERRALLDNILYIDQQRPSWLHLIIATRENYFEQPDYLQRPRFIELVQHDNIRLIPLNDEELRRAIEEPLHRFNQMYRLNLRFQTGMVDLLVDTFRHLGASLPLVQYLLRLMWVEKHHLTHIAYNTLGGLEGVLDRHATAIYKGFDEQDQALIKALLMALVRPGIGGEYARKRIRYDLLLEKNPHPERIRNILKRLTHTNSRIISEQQIGDTLYLELTHEILLRQWKFLHQLIELYKEQIMERELLLPTAELWLQGRTGFWSNWDSSNLYNGANLRRARKYLKQSVYSEQFDASIAQCYWASLRYRRNMQIFLLIVLGITLPVGFVVFQNAVDRSSSVERGRADQNATAHALALVEANRNATAETIALHKADKQATSEAEIRVEKQAQQARQDAGLIATVLENEQIPLEKRLLFSVESVGRYPDLKQVNQLRSLLDRYPWSFRIASAPPSQLFNFTVDFDNPDVTFQNPLAFSPDGTKLLADYQGKLVVWDVLEAKEAVHPLGNTDAPSAAAYSPDGSKIAFGLDSGAIGFLTSDTYKPIQATSIRDLRYGYLHKERISHLLYNHDGSLLLSIDINGSGQLHDTFLSTPLEGINTQVHYAAFASQGDRLVLLLRSDEGDYQTHLYSTSNGVLLWEGQSASKQSASFSADGASLLVRSDERLDLIDVEQASLLASISTEEGHFVHAAFSQIENHVEFQKSNNNYLELWAYQTGEFRQVYSNDSLLKQFDPLRNSFGYEVERFLVGPKATATVDKKGELRFWYPELGQAHREFELGEMVQDVVFTHDGQSLVITTNRNIVVWEVDADQPRIVISDLKTPLKYSALSLNDQRLLIQNESTVQVWSLQDASLVYSFPISSTSKIPLAISPDGKTLALYDDTVFRLVNLDQGTEQLLTNNPEEVVFTADGEHMILRRFMMPLQMIDRTGKEAKQLAKYENGLYNLRIDPQGNYLAVESLEDNSIQIWSIPKGVRVRTLATEGYVSGFAFSADGKSLISGDQQVWDIRTGLIRSQFDPLVSATIHRDGNLIAYRSSASTVAITSLDPNDLLWSALCRVALRLTNEDWRRYNLQVASPNVASSALEPRTKDGCQALRPTESKPLITP